MRLILALFLFTPILLSGCVATMTGAQQRGNEVGSAIQSAHETSRMCMSEVSANMPLERQIVERHILSSAQDPELLRKKMSKESVSPELADAYVRYVTQMDRCASRLEQGLQLAFPPGALIFREYRAAKDQMRILFLDGKLTIGQFNIQLEESNNIFGRQFQAALEQFHRGLAEDHNREVAQRQAAWAAFSQSMTESANRNAQILQNWQNSTQQNQPVYTNCVRSGVTTNCVSR
jgi:predicted small secreted protein